MITAKEILDAYVKFLAAQAEFGEAAVEILGFDAEGEWPYEDYRFDWHDCSFEFDGCLNSFRLTAEQVKAFADMGFERWWLNHLDGSETRYYRLDGGEWGSDLVKVKENGGAG